MIKILNFEINLKLIILPLIYIIIGIIVYELLSNIITKVTVNNKKHNLKNHQKQRIETLRILILNIIKYITVIIVTLLILSTYGINVSSILAGLGITTAIIGLAFQDLAKDIIAGFSIITEAQYEVGDTIEVDGFMGEVIFLGLKTTRIRNFKGATKIISNHNMDKIINYSLHNSLAVVDVSVGYEHNSDQVEKILTELAEKLNGTIPEAKGDIQVIGLTSLDDSSINYRVTVETNPMQHYAVERNLKKEIKKAFDKAKIKIPFPQIEVHNGK